MQTNTSITRQAASTCGLAIARNDTINSFMALSASNSRRMLNRSMHGAALWHIEFPAVDDHNGALRKPIRRIVAGLDGGASATWPHIRVNEVTPAGPVTQYDRRCNESTPSDSRILLRILLVSCIRFHAGARPSEIALDQTKIYLLATRNTP